MINRCAICGRPMHEAMPVRHCSAQCHEYDVLGIPVLRRRAFVRKKLRRMKRRTPTAEEIESQWERVMRLGEIAEEGGATDRELDVWIHHAKQIQKDL